MNNMNGVNSYNAMQKNLYSTASQSRRTAKADSRTTDETKKTNSNSVQLSDKAKALLQELKNFHYLFVSILPNMRPMRRLLNISPVVPRISVY